MTDTPPKGSAIRSVRVPDGMGERLKKFADANSMSVSEIVRDAMQAYIDDKVPFEDRMRTTERITVWVPPEMFAQFKAKVKANGLTITSALESSVEGIL